MFMRADQKLKASLKEIDDLKAALDEHAIVAITDPQGKITYVNDKFCAISKYSRAELLGQDHRLINSRHHAKEFIHDLWTTIANGQVWKGEIKNRAKDGSFYWVDTTIVPFLNGAGKPRQYVAIRADITERKQAEEAAARLAAIVQYSDDAIIGKNLDGIVTSWNRGAEQIFGYSAAEMLGQPILRLIPPDRQNEEAEILASVRRGESIRHLDTVRVRKDGSLIDVSISTSAIKDKAGHIIGASKIARDITERKQAEEKVRQLNAELEQKVASRTAELKAANAELEAYSYSISHDLRAPLRAMSGFARILEEQFKGQLTSEAQHAIERICTNATKMGQLIDGLLDFSSLNWRPVTKKSLQPTRIARGVFEELRQEIGARRVVIKIDSLPRCAADPTLLKQVFVNLLSNALKYSRDRNPARIKVGSHRKNGETVYFVQDNGAGFNMEYAGKLFRVFQRLHTPDQFEGTGAGLAIVHRIIQRHDGRIWAEAAVDQGATFYFTMGKTHSNHD
jgi:PAS domain S-box-containing protein